MALGASSIPEFSDLRSRQLALQPRPRHAPVTNDGRARHIEQVGNLLQLHAGKELHVDHLGLSRTDLASRSSTTIQGKQIDKLLAVGGQVDFLDADARCAGSGRLAAWRRRA